MLLEEHHVSAFVADHRVVPAAVELTAFDLQRPQRVLKARSEGGGQTLHVVTEAHGPYGETQVAPQPPSVVLDQVRRRAEQHLGESQCARLAPGYVFSLGEHDHPKLSGDYALAGVRHEGQTEDLASPTYSNRFTTVPKTFLLRPKRPARRVRQALETALVTGPPGEEIHTDPLGRIQVRFHWDDHEDKDAPTSCWIRVAQSWAGAGWGAQFIPRVGMEALVAFLGGDPDRPVVVGCLPNATHPPAFPLPDNKARSGWKSRSTPDHPNAGSNEISFEDASGGERVSIIAKRDLDIGVTQDMHTTVSGEYVLEVASSHDVVIAGSQRTTVRGVGACSYGAGGDLDVEGDLTERIAGDQRTAVRQDHVQDIGGSMRSTIKGDRKETVTGPWTQEAESLYTLVVGSHEADGHAEVQVRGSSAHVTEGYAIVEAKESLTLICGESRVELTPHSITIRAQRVGIEAKDIVVQGDGPALRLTDRAEIVADQLKLFGKESSLELDRDATVKGSKVYLNCGPPPPPTEDDEGAPNLQKLKLRLSDELFHPYAEKRFELRAGAFKADGVTGTDGTVEVDVPKTARVAQVEVWTEDYPTGPRKTYTIAIGPIEAPETLPGLRARLKNLGYFHGADAGAELDEATVAALRQFQADHGLPVTGQPDTETSAVIVERHGH
jgi:type VI secretion system secreted protein VgrG